MVNQQIFKREMSNMYARPKVGMVVLFGIKLLILQQKTLVRSINCAKWKQRLPFVLWFG